MQVIHFQGPLQLNEGPGGPEEVDHLHENVFFKGLQLKEGALGALRKWITCMRLY